MYGNTLTRPAILRELDDGLILRRSTLADAERLVAFNGETQHDPGATEPDAAIMAWVRDLMTRPHPTFRPEDFTIVEDPRTGAIVSSLCLIDQVWTYAGIPFAAGQPELVGTHPDYRNRGLIRAQFEVIHEWAAERGQLVEGITGIPYYYRQFGYEMALTLGGGHIGSRLEYPKLAPGTEEPYILRPATEADLPWLLQMHQQATRRWLMACPFDEAAWRYELSGRSEANVHRIEYRIIETPDGTPVGLFAHRSQVNRGMLVGTMLEIETATAGAAGASWLDVTPCVLRYLVAEGQRYAERSGGEFKTFALALGPEHPAYAAAERWAPTVNKPYAWYLRVPDLRAFLQRITPALDARLAASPAAGHTGEIKLSFYRSGLRLGLDRGRLAAIEPWQPKPEIEDDAAFPGLTFLQLLFGYRDLEELRYAFADCWVGGDVPRVILTSLFPKKPSRLASIM